jgi:hypothetical protein
MSYKELSKPFKITFWIFLAIWLIALITYITGIIGCKLFNYDIGIDCAFGIGWGVFYIPALGLILILIWKLIMIVKIVIEKIRNK